MQSEELRVPVPHAGVEWVSAVLDRPDEDDAGRGVFLLAHGAGAPLDSAFMTTVATGLAERGLAVLRFNYVYAERMTREGKRRAPDRKERLLETHRAALTVLRERYPERRVVLAGKSMGGRMSTYMAAEGDDVAGLVLFGYPLHPPGKPDKLRSEHFAAIAQPALFLQGTRDALGGVEALRGELETFGGAVTLEQIEGGDHDFKVPKAAGRTRAEVLNGLVGHVVTWEGVTWP